MSVDDAYTRGAPKVEAWREAAGARARGEKAIDRKLRAHGEVAPSRKFADGTTNPYRIGARLGYVWLRDQRTVEVANGPDPRERAPRRLGDAVNAARVSIQSIGKVYWGGQPCALGVALGSTSVFIARAKTLARFPGVRLPAPAPNIRALDRGTARAYGDTVARAWADAVTPLPVRASTREATRRYHDLVRSHVGRTILECAGAGERRTEKDFARFVNPEWVTSDLITPRHPTVTHALLVSLVLALDASYARHLIYYAGLCEYRLPVLTEAGAAGLYTEARRLLAALSPGWWSRAHLWDWKVGGALDEVLQAQWCRMVAATFGRGMTPGELLSPHGVAAVTPDGDALLDLRAATEAREEPVKAPGRPVVDDAEDDDAEDADPPEDTDDP